MGQGAHEGVVSSAKQWVKRDLELSWRWLFNRDATLDHRRDHPALGPVATRVLADLRRDGVVLVPVDELCGPGLLDRMQARVEELMASRAEDGERVAADGVKPFLVELLGERPELSREETLLELVRHPQLRGLVEGYYGMRVRVRELNAWLNRPVGEQARMSQRWHRDLPEDHHIVKVFLYLRPVTSASGALQYVRGSHRGRGQRIGRGGAWDGVNYRLESDDVARLFQGHDVVTATGPVGTLVIADTRGMHRGGHVLSGERLLVYGRYASRSAVGPAPLTAATPADELALPDLVLTGR